MSHFSIEIILFPILGFSRRAGAMKSVVSSARTWESEVAAIEAATAYIGSCRANGFFLGATVRVVAGPYEVVVWDAAI